MDSLTRRFAKKSGPEPDAPVLSPREAYWINVGIIWVLFPASAVAAMAVDPAWGLWVPCFTVLNGLSHIIAGIKDRRYNPGLVASLILNIPVGTTAIFILADTDIAGAGAWAVSILIATGFMAFIVGYAIFRNQAKYKKS